MKRFFTILLLIAPICVSAENYFTEGTQWKVMISGEYPYELWSYNVIYSLEKSAVAEECEHLELYCTKEGDPSSKQLVHRLRSDGDKVYILLDDTSTEWDLIYDFGLQPGQSANVRMANYSNEWSYVKYQEAATEEDYGGFPCMIMDEFCDEELTQPRSTGTWLTGIGGLGGPLDNAGYDFAGGLGYRLLSVTHNGEDICSYIRDVAIPDVPVSPGASEAPAVYYDMQGRPAQPDKPGVYIRKSPQATSKTIVR